MEPRNLAMSTNSRVSGVSGSGRLIDIDLFDEPGSRYLSNFGAKIQIFFYSIKFSGKARGALVISKFGAYFGHMLG